LDSSPSKVTGYKLDAGIRFPAIAKFISTLAPPHNL